MRIPCVRFHFFSKKGVRDLSLVIDMKLEMRCVRAVPPNQFNNDVDNVACRAADSRCVVVEHELYEFLCNFPLFEFIYQDYARRRGLLLWLWSRGILIGIPRWLNFHGVRGIGDGNDFQEGRCGSSMNLPKELGVSMRLRKDLRAGQRTSVSR